MFPNDATCFSDSRGFPRARGDVPQGKEPLPRQSAFSPRTRGCSAYCGFWSVHRGVFPAHAGMFPSRSVIAVTCASFPRARGDVPARRVICSAVAKFSPRTRGCSRFAATRKGGKSVFPAHAGMFPPEEVYYTATTSFPRARGDVPATLVSPSPSTSFSPRTRGCSQHIVEFRLPPLVFPAHAGMFRFLTRPARP